MKPTQANSVSQCFAAFPSLSQSRQTPANSICYGRPTLAVSGFFISCPYFAGFFCFWTVLRYACATPGRFGA
jgi:hypothetical protein